MNDTGLLTQRNKRFIEACRQGSWLILEPLLSPGFGYLDGATGEVWDMDRYRKDLKENPAPRLSVDVVVIHVDGDTAILSARSQSGQDRSNRYLDTYKRSGGDWVCVHACVWPLPPTSGSKAC